MRAGFRFEPGRFGQNKNRNEESLLAESQQSCTPVPSQGVAPDDRTPLQERAWALTVHNADPSANSWTRFKCAKQKGSRTLNLEGEASADPGLEGAESPSNRNAKLTCKPPVKFNISTNDGDEPEHLPGSSGTQSSAEVNGVCGKFCDEMCSPTNSDASGMSPQVCCQEKEKVGATNELAETCQRARAYFRKNSFSCARTDMPWPLLNSGLTRASFTATPACPALLADPPDTVSSSISTNKQGALNGCSNEKLFGAPDGPSPGSRQWINPQEDESRDGLLTGGNDKLQGNTSSHSPDSTKKGFAPHSFQAEEAPTSPPSNGPGVHGRESSADIHSPLPHSGHQSDCSGTSPPPSALSDMDTTSSLNSTSVTLAGASSASSNAKSSEQQLFISKGAQMISCSPSFASAHSCDSFHSSESPLFLPQDKRDCDEDPLSRSPKLLPHCEGSPTDDESDAVHSLLCRTCGETDNALPPMLSPVTSPCRRSWRSLLSWSPGFSERKEHEEEDTCRHKSPQPVHGSRGNSSVDLQLGFEGSAEVLKPAPPSEPQFPPSSQNAAEPSSPSTCTDVSSDALDEVTAYKRDILLVDVTQDDAELFENVPQKSFLKLGPVRFSEDLKCRPLRTARKHQLNSDGASVELGQRSTPVLTNYNYDSADDTEESNKRPWRPQSSSSSSSNFKMQSTAWSVNETHKESVQDLPDANNNQTDKSSERYIFRTQPIKSLNPLHSHNPAALSKKNGPCVSYSANSSEFRRQKSNSYCWKYFSDFTTCGYEMCRFQHVPLVGDEKFCIEIISRFTKNPMCLHKAQAVFTSYYLNNPPGVCFSMPILLSLLWALLKAGMVSDIFSILNVSVTHKIAPGHEFVLAVFNFVREKGHVSLLPELMQLTIKMAAAGLVLSFDWMDGLPNNGDVQPAVCTNANSGKATAPAPCLGYLNVAHAVVEIELCSKLEDWRRMGDVFMSVCQSIQRPNQLEQISGRVAIALLSESKDKHAVPFAAFAETVSQKEQDHMTMTYFGRIGVSLMLRYHKTHQWAKGRRVAEVLSFSKINYPTLKGLFGNEDGASRCFLVTMATELFLLSGNIEGALNTLRENSWFLSSSLWPCEPADVESRIRVLLRLAEKTSDRATLEILCNLPGLKEPTDFVNISNYCSVFNTHLLVCVDRQALPVASDLVDLMLAKQLPIEPTSLQALLQKLGKQNLWLRAREVFKHSLSQGYYQGVSAPPGFMALMVPCRLEEVELVLAFEMFITVNASIILHPAENTTSSLSITLKRTRSSESEYLSAGSRLLSAASIPQPNLVIHYTAVNSSQEQVFTMDLSSARSWLRHNHLWANEVWAH